jgi:hypothetical protein
MEYNDAGQISKADAEYTDKSKSPAEHRCGICTQIRKCYVTGEHYCTVVEGPVIHMGGCKLFDMDLIKNANSKITLATDPPEK